VADIDLVPVTDGSPALRDWFEVVSAAWAVDGPEDHARSWMDHKGSLRFPFPGELLVVEVAYRERVPVGFLVLYLPMRDNLDAAPCEVVVHPAYRHQGIGRLLLEAVRERAAAHGRNRLVGESIRGDDSDAFLGSAGARVVLASTQRRLTLPDGDEPFADLLADARGHADGYSLVQWRGACPEEHVGDLAVLESRLVTDAPLDDLAWEPEDYDATRMRELDRMREGRGIRSCTTGARHDASGHVVAYTSVVIYHEHPEAGHQWQTIVAPEHRGHRLGMLLKVENIRLIRRHEPQVRIVDTNNADSNEHMLAINLTMGFEVVRHWAEWELALAP
jgi:GNAT superfamily N-acetyltransferase